MKTSDFLRDLENALEVDEGSLTESGDLESLDFWDSMAALTFIALADEKLQVNVSGNQIRDCRTVRELLALLGDRVTSAS